MSNEYAALSGDYTIDTRTAGSASSPGTRW